MCLLNFYSSGQTKISSTQAEHFINKPLSSADLYRKWAFFWWASLALWCGKLERDLFCLQSGGGLVAKSCPTLCDPMNCVACQVPLSMGFSIQEYWVGLPFPSPGNLPNPGTEPSCPALQADSLLPSHQGSLVEYLPVFLPRGHSPPVMLRVSTLQKGFNYNITVLPLDGAPGAVYCRFQGFFFFFFFNKHFTDKDTNIHQLSSLKFRQLEFF